MRRMNKIRAQYIFTWISLGGIVVGSMGILVSAWNGVQKGQLSAAVLILFWILLLAAGIYLFMLAVKKAHRQWVQEDRQKKKEAAEDLISDRRKRSSRKDKEVLDPAATARKMVRKIPGDTQLEKLGKELMGNLARELEIMSGVYYLRKGNRFESISTYALTSPHAPDAFSAGEGLNGQSAQNRQIRVLTSLPEGYLEVCSGLGKAPPSYVAIVPLVKDEECIALFECAGYKYSAQEIESTLRIFSRDLSGKLFNPPQEQHGQ